jgi:hypothetical protein
VRVHYVCVCTAALSMLHALSVVVSSLDAKHVALDAPLRVSWSCSGARGLCVVLRRGLEDVVVAPALCLLLHCTCWLELCVRLVSMRTAAVYALQCMY